MKVDLSYHASGTEQPSLPGRLLLALTALLFAAGSYAMFSELVAQHRSGYPWLIIFLAYIPGLLKRYLYGPSVLAVSFWPAMFSYHRGFVWKGVRIRNMAGISAEGDFLRVSRKNGTSFTVPRGEFPEVDFAALAQRLEQAAKTHIDLVWFFQMNSVGGFRWADPALAQPASDGQKKMAAVFFASLALALAAWALYVFMGM